MGFGPPPPSGRRVFSSDVQATAVLPAVADDIPLPSVTIPSNPIPSGSKIDRVLAALAWRKQVNSSGSVNKANGAQKLQVRDNAPGTWRDAIDAVDDMLHTAALATEAGTVLVGDNDISVEVDGPGTYEFQWAQARFDVASLTLYDVQAFLIVEYS